MAYWVTGAIAPFDASQQVTRRVPATTDNPAMDTSAVDGYRMGVELRSFVDVYNSSQPKMWGGEFDKTGSITHQQNIENASLGQAVSFTSFFATPAFEFKPKFNPTAYIQLADNYPLPIIFNDGPQAQQEAIIEPLTIPQRLNDVESFDVAHASRGEMELGEMDGRGRGSAQVEQFEEYDLPISPRPWLSQGHERFGESVTGSINIPGYLSKIQRTLSPWKKQTNDYLHPYVNGFSDSAMSGALLKLDINNNGDIRPAGKRSASAGHTVYGPRQRLTGTDSIAFVGWIRGS